MKEFIARLTELIGNGELNEALLQMSSLLTLASSELKNDAILLRGRLNKLKSDVRRGIVDVKDENLEFNKISVGTLDLIELMKENTPQLQSYLDDMNDSIKRDTPQETELESISKIKHALVSPEQKNALFERMAFVKEKKLNLRALWIDDNMQSISSEQRLISALGVSFDFVQSSAEAEKAIDSNLYHFIISDNSREGNTKEGIHFLKYLATQREIRIPSILYIMKVDEKYGIPPYTFGLTNRPTELIHLVLDIIERM